MSIETDTKVAKLMAWQEQATQQIQQLQFQNAQILSAINAMTEVNNNAVVEGEDLTPATANGKISKGRKAHR